MPSPKKHRVSTNPVLIHWVAVGTIAATLFLGVLRYIFIDWADPLRCYALARQGQWLDEKFSNWQPEGCILHNYASKDISTCLMSRRIIFIDATLPAQPVNNEQKHTDYTLSSSDQNELIFIWDPFLNTTKTHNILLAKDISSNSASPSIRTPALLVIGSGLWFLRHGGQSGLSKWEATVEDTLRLIRSQEDPIADIIAFLPVENIIDFKLSPEKAETMHNTDIDAMNSDLRHRIYPHAGYIRPSSKMLRTSIEAPYLYFVESFLNMPDASQTEDGLHYSEKITRVKSNVLLNLRCNDRLPKKFPFEKTCCSSYPYPLYYQTLLLVLLGSWGILAKVITPRLSRQSKLLTIFPSEENMTHLSIFGLSILLFYLADRTPIWAKEQKQFNPWVFAFWMFLNLVIGLGTLKKADKDLGFLNREQTDEWKGWMQIVILAYHYFGASKISGIYNPVRVLVAAYLFMTGYGHTTYYLTKADFGFLRVAQVLVRLNLLPIILAYVMDTNYLYYYFSPLVSMWFLILYITMVIGKTYNERMLFLLTKILLSMVVVTIFMSHEWLLEEAFLWLDRLCAIHWSAEEWAFRAQLDLWVVYTGMLAAIANIKFREYRMEDNPYWSAIHKTAVGGSVVVLIWFFVFELTRRSKFIYNVSHPYISFLPIGAFVVLRNANPILRSASSRAFAFIGRCSLETFIIQFHFWLAADTKGVLLVLPGTRWRPVNIIVSTIMFIWLSHKFAIATGALTNWICGSPKKGLPTVITHTPQTSTLDLTQAEEIPLNTKNIEVGRASPVAERWVDRLANGRRSTGWKPGLGVRLTALGFVMWFINVTWPT